MTFLEQKPRWGLVPRGQAANLSCILKDSQYPWLSWYQQDLQKQLQLLVTLRSPGDKEVKSLPGADYLATRVSDTELRLQVANLSQGRTLYCTCSRDTVVNSAGALEQKPHIHPALPSNPCSSASPSELSSFLPRLPHDLVLAKSALYLLICHFFCLCLIYTVTQGAQSIDFRSSIVRLEDVLILLYCSF